MKRVLVSASCLVAALVALGLPAQAQRKRSPTRQTTRAQRLPPEKVSVAPALPDAGSFTGGVYTNRYFGLVLAVPEGWQVVDRDTEALLHKKGGELMAGDSSGLKAMVQEGQETSINLFTLVKMLPAAGGGGAPTTFMFMAVATPVPAGIFNTGEDYLDTVKILLGQAAVKTEFDGPVMKETMGGVEFATQQLHVTHLGTQIRQKLSATILKGHVIILTRVYLNEPDAQAFDEIVRAMKFK